MKAALCHKYNSLSFFSEPGSLEDEHFSCGGGPPLEDMTSNKPHQAVHIFPRHIPRALCKIMRIREIIART